MKYLYLLIFVLGCNVSFSQTADFTIVTAGNTFCAPQVVTFQQTSSGNPESFVWDFGNGHRGNRATERTTYLRPGTYTIKLIAIYRDVAVTKEKTIVVHPKPTIALSADRNTHCKTGDITFTARGSGSVRYAWDFGDGTPILQTADAIATHHFSQFGSFTVRVTGFNQHGCGETATTSVTLNPLNFSGTMSLTSGCLPARPQFRYITSLLPDDAVSSVVWEFGDGSAPVTNSSNNIQHTYTIPADISTAKVTLTTELGCTAEYQFPEFGFGNPPTNIDMAMVSGRDTFCASEEIEMQAVANGAEFYLWNFGDNVTDSVEANQVSHKYRKLGDMMVSVMPYQNGCAGTADSMQIHIEGVVAAFNVTNQCGALNTYEFPNESLGNISYFTWTYGDVPDYSDNVSFHGGYTFPASGSFFTKLLLYDDITGCRDSVEKPIYTAQPLFLSDKNSVCKDSLIRYRVENDYDPAANMHYFFHVNGDVLNNGTNNRLEYYPGEFGLYNDYLVIKDNYPFTCNDTVRLSEPVRVKGPVIAFDATRSICFDSSVVFNNTSHPYYDYEPIAEYEWNYGNDEGSSDNIPQPYAYPLPGNYQVSLTVTDVSGCAQRAIKPVSIRPLPIVDILPRRDSICQGNSVQLIAYSSDSTYWSPAPGLSCIGCDSTVVRPMQTTAYIANAYSAYGCRISDSSVIKVYTPLNIGLLPSDTAICIGETVPLRITGGEGGIVTWSPEPSLHHAYSSTPLGKPDASTTYTVSITDSLGCFTDSAHALVRVNPLPEVNAGTDIRQDFNTPFTLNASYGAGIVSWQWTPMGGTLSCETCPNPQGVLLTNQEYTIEVTDQHGCVNQDKVMMMVNCSNSQLLIPSAFTPNGDGLNDYFYPVARGFDKIMAFMVFDRAGNKVFERKNFSPNAPSMGWDGTFKGRNKFTTQTFVWMAQVECEGNILTQKGTITMIR